jgi:2-polyprenyl-6-methoxyphenol hydroxylase-like FAD-dependent oxidoreductase
MAPPGVLVVGAGPVGLTAACELLRRGIEARIVDCAPARTEHSRALAVQARTLEVLDAMGIAERFVAAGTKLHGLNVYADGARIVHVDFDDIDSPFPYVLSLPQSDTERILGERLTELGGRVEREVTLTALAQDSGAVSATLTDASGRTEHERFAWLVGCDGSHSAVRHALGLTFDGAPYGESFVLGDAHLTWELPGDEMHAFIGPAGPLAAFPLPHGRWRLVAEVRNECRTPEGSGLERTAAVDPPTLDDFERLLRERGAPAARLRDAGWLAAFGIHRRIVPRLREGRVFLAGDAAHIHSPAGGQGMNTGMQDAYNLAWKLSLVSAGAGREALLDSYDAERRPIAAATLVATDVATRVVTMRHPVARELRDGLGALLSSIDAVQKRILAQSSELAVSYRASSIVDEHRSSVARATVGKRVGEQPTLADWVGFAGAPHPGDRAPDVVIDPATTLFALLRHTRSTLLLFDGAAPTAEGYRNLLDVAARTGERWGAHVETWIVVPRRMPPNELSGFDRVLLDPKGALHRRYGAGSECVYVIRPDGYVGFRSQPAAWRPLQEHLSMILV